MWGIIPAAGKGSRIQPLPFSKELLPIGSTIHCDTEHPKVVSEYLIERMVIAGVDKICMIISPEKSDILRHYGKYVSNIHISFVMQQYPQGLCDAIFAGVPIIDKSEEVIIGLPDTVWFPSDALCQLPVNELSFLLFRVEQPHLYDAVEIGIDGYISQIRVKETNVTSNLIWGAFKMPGTIFHKLYELWLIRERKDEFFGTLVNAYLEIGGKASGIYASEQYVDIGTMHGYRNAIKLLWEVQDIQNKKNKAIVS
jgi:dTDP-glucose pyrophosphorylase